MTFRDFMTLPLSALSRLARRDSAPVEVPRNLTPKNLSRIVAALLDDRRAESAQQALTVVAERSPTLVVAALVAASRDTRFHTTQPFRRALDVLEAIDPSAAHAACLPLVTAESKDARLDAAKYLGHLATLDTIPIFQQVLQDPDGLVRWSVGHGVEERIEAVPELREALYPMHLEQCDREWPGCSSGAPGFLFKLDPVRAARDLASERFLTPRNPVVNDVIEAFDENRATAPEHLVRPLLAHAMRQIAGAPTNPGAAYPNNWIAAAALKVLARSVGEGARADLVAATESHEKYVRVAASQGLRILAGLDDPIDYVCRRRDELGLRPLTQPQQWVYCAMVFVWEVENGGLSQFFGNTSGVLTPYTLPALEAIGHPEALAALREAIRLLGPAAFEADRDLRIAPFATRYDELQAAFEPLERAFYKTSDGFRQAVLNYAIANAEHFRD